MIQVELLAFAGLLLITAYALYRRRKDRFSNDRLHMVVRDEVATSVAAGDVVVNSQPIQGGLRKMSSVPQLVRLGSKLDFSYEVLRADGTVDASATIGNVDLSVDNVTDTAGVAAESSRFATLTAVDGQHDVATMSTDAANIGVKGTFVAKATVTFAATDGSTPVTKQLTAQGSAELSSSPGAGDTLQMVVTVE